MYTIYFIINVVVLLVYYVILFIINDNVLEYNCYKKIIKIDSGAANIA